MSSTRNPVWAVSGVLPKGSHPATQRGSLGAGPPRTSSLLPSPRWGVHTSYFAQGSPQKKWNNHHGQQKSPKCSTWMQSQKRQNDLCSFPRQTIQYHSNPSLCPWIMTINVEEAEAEWFYEDLQDLLELTPKRDVLFIIGDWNAKVGSQETPGGNRQIWP